MNKRIEKAACDLLSFPHQPSGVLFRHNSFLETENRPPPIPKIPTLIGWDFFCLFPQCWRGFRAWPRERPPCEGGVFAPADASLFSVFSGGHASVLEAISFAGAGLEAVGCGWQLL